MAAMLKRLDAMDGSRAVRAQVHGGGDYDHLAPTPVQAAAAAMGQPRRQQQLHRLQQPQQKKAAATVTPAWSMVGGPQKGGTRGFHTVKESLAATARLLAPTTPKVRRATTVPVHRVQAEARQPLQLTAQSLRSMSFLVKMMFSAVQPVQLLVGADALPPGLWAHCCQCSAGY